MEVWAFPFMSKNYKLAGGGTGVVNPQEIIVLPKCAGKMDAAGFCEKVLDLFAFWTDGSDRSTG